MGKNKRKKFSELKTLSNVFENYKWDSSEVLDENGNQIDLKGRWHSEIFENNKPIVLELACGQGHYARALAQQHPEKNYIGVDVKGNRIWSAAKRAIEMELDNVRFLRTRIEQLEMFFDKDEVDEIWITFPDPFNRQAKHKKRLTSQQFLDKYREVLKPDGIIHLKTDSQILYDYTLSVFEDYPVSLLENFADVYAEEREDERLYIKTYYEGMHLQDGRIIKYLKFRLKD